MDDKRLPEKLLKQQKQDHLKQSYFMAYNEILNFLIFQFFCREFEKKSYIIFIYRLIIMNILI